MHPEEVGRREFLTPDKKTLTLNSESGSGLVRHMALNPLIKSEIEAAAGKEHHDSAISAANYSLNLLGEQQVGPFRCFVAEPRPKRQDKYLFEGKLWIDVDDYSVGGSKAIARRSYLSGSNALISYSSTRKLRFWLPQKDQTLVQVPLYGKKVLTIEHREYMVNAGQKTKARAIVPEAAIALTSLH